MSNWCPWCKKTKEPGEKWQEGPAIIPEGALSMTCPECKSKLYREHGIEEKAA